MIRERSIRYLLSTFDLGGNPGSSLAAWRWQQRVEQRINALHLELAAEVPIVAALDWVTYTPAHTFSDWAEEVRLHLERGAAKSDLQVFLGGNHLGVMPLYLWWLGRQKGAIAVLDAHHDFNPTQDSRRTMTSRRQAFAGSAVGMTPRRYRSGSESGRSRVLSGARGSSCPALPPQLSAKACS